jgi:hypothetical protein
LEAVVLKQLDPSRIVEYLRKAAEADEKSRLATAPQVRQAWRAIAESWRQLAEHARYRRL